MLRRSLESTLSFPLFSSLAFDLTITSVFVPLVSGGRIVVYPHTTGLREISIHKIIEDNEVDIIKLTPSHLLLMQSMDLVGSRVKKLILGGEDLRTDIARTITRRFGGDVEIYNEYGPTEATVGCMIYRFDPARDTDISVPIGRAIDNLRVYVLDDYAHPQPQGVAGEIFIGGAGLSRGYLNREDVTHEKFVDDPFKPGELMYATGDLARWNAGGQMEYLGRKDEQIKIRGVRIELGEVETALLEHEAVGSCVVDLLVRNDALQDEDYCTQCGLSARHPDAHLDDEGVCRICRIHADVGVEADVYFRDLADLKPVLANARKSSAGKQDCMMLLSGGKDSTYALCRLVDLGFTPIVFTLDNGFISDGAKENIRCVVDQLGLELVIGTTSAMSAIFVDSLNRFSNVCNGCFKTIYTLSMNIAHERGIKHIMTGLSRGQIFETRIAGLFQQRIFDPHEIDRNVIEARKAYHRMDDAVSRSLDVSIFQNDDIFDEIEFIDFYRYCDTTLDDIYAYLAERVPWVRPRDTGRSTNCRINELGIFVHTRERGFHNYALPYSWDVRLGHKERDAALKELDDDIDVDNVRSILDEIGYRTEEAPSSIETDKFLAAYFCTNDAIDAADLRIFLSTRLPAEFIPRHFIEIEEIPLTSNGKVDRAALPHPDRSRPELTVAYVPPRSDIEKKLSSVWSNVLGVDRIGVDDNFFEFGGDSILNIQIVARARKLGVGITPQQIFDHPTIAELAQVTDTVDVSVREQGPVEGPVPLTPMQRRFFERCDRQTLGQVQAVLLTLSDDVDIALLEAAVGFLRSHHDALRARYYDAGGEWHQQLTPVTEARIVAERIDLSSMSATEQERALNRFLVEANLSLDIGAGRLIHMACFERGGSGDRTVAIVVHRLVIDSVSWWILIEDLEAAYEHLARGDEIKLPLKTSSVKRWSQALSDYALSDTPHREAAYWSALTSESGHIPLDFTDRGPNDRSTVRTVSQALAAADTKALLNEVPTAYRVQIPELIITAVAESIVAWSGTPDCLIDVEGHGREEIANNIDLLRTVGWISTMYPVALRLESDDPDSHLKAVKERLRAVPNLGIGYGVLRYLSHQDDIVEIPVKIEAAPVSFNYLGQWEHAMSGSSGLHIAQPIIDLPGNVGPRAHVIDIDATVFDGELRMNWHYSSNYHQRSTIEGLASSCIAALQALIGYCLAHAGGGLSPSDFPSADRDQEALDELLADFGDTTK